MVLWLWVWVDFGLGRRIGSGLWVGFGSLKWFYGRGCELIGVAWAWAYGCGLIDLVVDCCGLGRVVARCEIFLWCAMVDRFGDWLWVCCGW